VWWWGFTTVWRGVSDGGTNPAKARHTDLEDKAHGASVGLLQTLCPNANVSENKYIAPSGSGNLQPAQQYGTGVVESDGGGDGVPVEILSLTYAGGDGWRRMTTPAMWWVGWGGQGRGIDRK
jgi:hypothetical protein